MDTKVIKVVNAGKCMMCGREIKIAIGRGSGKFPNIFFCSQCEKLKEGDLDERETESKKV